MDLWLWSNMKVICRKFTKDHCFWTLWTLTYVDCIPFSCIDSFHVAHNQPYNLRKFCFRISEKHDQTFIFVEGVLWNQSCSSVYPSVCTYVCDTIFSGSTQWIFLIFCTIYTKKWQIQILVNCICCQDKCYPQEKFGPKAENLAF